MKQEDKELLLKDLLGRLSYGVICNCLHDYRTMVSAVDAEDLTVYYPYCDEWESLEYCKPYLRPMSSMTEKEKVQLSQYACIGEDLNGEFIDEVQRKDCAAYIDWLNAHHFDYRELIPKGLALEAPKDMYNN